MNFPLSILDLSPTSDRFGASQALRNTLDLGKRADQLGFRRYWVAEHHNCRALISTAPELMIGQIAAVTKRIRVGFGGMMLLNHSPLHLSEIFRVLEALYPGRIDLGIGRASGSDPLTTLALRGSEARLAVDNFDEQVEALLCFGANHFPASHTLGGVRSMPDDVPIPPVFLLGSSDYSAKLAGKLGLGFVFAHHFRPERLVSAAAAYREHFKPSVVGGQAPAYLIVAASVVCGETDSDAERLASSVLLQEIFTAQGKDAALPPPEDASDDFYTAMEEHTHLGLTNKHMIGNPESIRSKLDEIVEQTGADEMMIATAIHGHAERVRSYELLAEGCESNSFGKVL